MHQEVVMFRGRPDPENLTAKTAKIARSQQLSSSQEGNRTEIFRVVPRSPLRQSFECGKFLCGLCVLCG